MFKQFKRLIISLAKKFDYKFPIAFDPLCTQLLHRYNEAIAKDYIDPFRVVPPS